MYYGFEHRLQGKAQEAAMAQLFLEDQERQMQLIRRCRFILPNVSCNYIRKSSWQPLVQEAMEKNQASNHTRIPEDLHFPDVCTSENFPGYYRAV